MHICAHACVCVCVLSILAEKANHLRSNEEDVSKIDRLIRPSYDQSNINDRSEQLLCGPGHSVIQN